MFVLYELNRRRRPSVQWNMQQFGRTPKGDRRRIQMTIITTTIGSSTTTTCGTTTRIAATTTHQDTLKQIRQSQLIGMCQLMCPGGGHE